MDTIYKAKKLQATHSYKARFLDHSLAFPSLLALTCSFLCFYPYWFPFLCSSSMKKNLLLSLQSNMSSVFSPKCVFIVVNVIVAFLVGESKLVGSSSQSSSPSAEIYDDYVERSRSLRRASTLQGKATEEQPRVLELNLIEEKASDIIQDQKVIMEEKASDIIIQEKKVMELEDKEVINELPKKVDKQEEAEDINEEKEEIDEEENGLPTEELNRRVEEFIARVNKQRLLETRLLVCCKA